MARIKILLKARRAMFPYGSIYCWLLPVYEAVINETIVYNIPLVYQKRVNVAAIRHIRKLKSA